VPHALLCTREDEVPHAGHAACAGQYRAVNSTPDGALSIVSTITLPR
jgi:hypothetical protein